MAKLGAKVDDNSLIKLTKEDLVELGIEMGPRVMILDLIQVITSTTLQPQDIIARNKSPVLSHEPVCGSSSALPCVSPDVQMIKETLENAPGFYSTLYNELYDNKIPDINKIRQMTRILCNRWFYQNMIEHHRYPTMHEKWNLAKSILVAFPQLEGTRRMPEAPKESAFFWKNGGNLRGAHTGLIETRTNNMRKDLPREKRKFTRDKDLVIMAAVDDDIVEKAELCAAISAVTENVRRIGELMESTFYYHKYLLKTGATFSDIISVFPHLLSFVGDMIQQAFSRLNTTQEGSVAATLKRCCLISNTTFAEVEDKYIRGALRALVFLTARGTKRETTDKMLSAAEIVAAPLIKWVEEDEWAELQHKSEGPILICIAEKFKAGRYVIMIDETHHVEIATSEKAVEIFFKSFTVFNIKPNSCQAKIIDLIELCVFKTIKYSSRNRVNDLCNALSQLND
ncbi:uncharacterized protein LOC129731502 isoform X2 [Wyeomyia smithii]|uniref:uncharacterized protein LOC129731502 isoform X2 n=1 Tax=Wyeomyia smithii TaxID=174621 RepID=UPI002467BC11|nr:uncharacterized protein LOC129731502 isoform X2 [Wyeomyia smithii]